MTKGSKWKKKVPIVVPHFLSLLRSRRLVRVMNEGLTRTQKVSLFLVKYVWPLEKTCHIDA